MGNNQFNKYFLGTTSLIFPVIFSPLSNPTGPVLSGRSFRGKGWGLGIGVIHFLLHISSHSSKCSNLVYGIGVGAEDDTLHMKRQGHRADRSMLGNKHRESTQGQWEKRPSSCSFN